MTDAAEFVHRLNRIYRKKYCEFQHTQAMCILQNAKSLDDISKASKAIILSHDFLVGRTEIQTDYGSWLQIAEEISPTKKRLQKKLKQRTMQIERNFFRKNLLK